MYDRIFLKGKEIVNKETYDNDMINIQKTIGDINTILATIVTPEKEDAEDENI